METTDPPCSENSDQQKVVDDQDPVQARSYECTFCKRGFSNAQALGGHMNIHRKDRAKLKQPLNLTKPSLDITKRSLSYPLLANKSELLEYIQDKSFNPMLPWTLPRDDEVITRGKNSVREVRQLDLFVESPSGRKEPKLVNDSTECEERTVQSIRSGSGNNELDLELRLGPEPLHNTKNAIIEFF